jgi:hypothetical protein
MNPQQKDLSYFSLRLQELLSTSFPEQAGDITFIEQRSGLAAQTYEDLFGAGYSTAQCDKISYYVLFQGLQFSKFDTIFQVVCNEFDTIMADEEFRPFAFKMLPICEPVFKKYPLTESFSDSPEYELLYTELTGTIAIWIEENELQ